MKKTKVLLCSQERFYETDSYGLGRFSFIGISMNKQGIQTTFFLKTSVRLFTKLVSGNHSLKLFLSLSLYIYIYSHRQTDCFIVSQLFRVARHTECFKLGLKPAKLNARHGI